MNRRRKKLPRGDGKLPDGGIIAGGNEFSGGKMFAEKKRKEGDVGN